MNVRPYAGEIVSHTDGAKRRKSEGAMERGSEKAKRLLSLKARQASHPQMVFQ